MTEKARWLSRIRYMEIASVLRKIDFPYAIIKGEPLSILAYSEPGRRVSGDIDFLIDPADVPNMEAILKEEGFQQGNTSRIGAIITASYSHQIRPYYKKSMLGIVCLDVNYSVFWGEYNGKPVDITEFLSDRIDMTIYGQAVKTCPPLKTLVQLALHDYKELNSLYLLATRRRIKAGMFQDFYRLLIENRKEVPIHSLLNICRQYDMVAYMYYMLYYTYHIYRDKRIKGYIDAFYTPFGNDLLDCYGLDDTERKKWRVDFQTRLASDDLYALIQADLSARDLMKIELNQCAFR